MEISIDKAEALVDAVRDLINKEEFYDSMYNHFFNVWGAHDTLSKEEFLSIALEMVNY